MPNLTPAEVLRAAAEQIEKDPAKWSKDFFVNKQTGCRCALGFIAYALDPGFVASNPYDLPDPAQRRVAAAAIGLLEDFLADEYLLDVSDWGDEPPVGWWNDWRATDAAEVAAAMRGAAERAR